MGGITNALFKNFGKTLGKTFGRLFICPVLFVALIYPVSVFGADESCNSASDSARTFFLDPCSSLVSRAKFATSIRDTYYNSTRNPITAATGPISLVDGLPIRRLRLQGADSVLAYSIKAAGLGYPFWAVSPKQSAKVNYQFNPASNPFVNNRHPVLQLQLPPPDVRRAWTQGWTGWGVNIMVADNFSINNGHTMAMSLPRRRARTPRAPIFTV